MDCFIDEYFLKSIAVVENDWILPKRNNLKELIKMKKHFQVNLNIFVMDWGHVCSTVVFSP